jgi:hypothetical protein
MNLLYFHIVLHIIFGHPFQWNGYVHFFCEDEGGGREEMASFFHVFRPEGVNSKYRLIVFDVDGNAWEIF